MKRIALSRKRRLIAGIALSLGSFLFIGIGLFAVVSALDDDSVQLPNEGTIEDIVGDDDQDDADQPNTRNVPGTGGGEPQDRIIHGPFPISMSIPRINVKDAPVVTLGIIEERNVPDVPKEGAQVGWFDFSATPGLSNNAVFTGHVDWETADRSPIAGVFYRLRELRIGDEITVALEDGEAITYRVTGNVATTYDDPNVVKAMDFTNKDVITLITCGGAWVESGQGEFGGNYTHRVIVRAERALDDASSVSNDPS